MSSQVTDLRGIELEAWINFLRAHAAVTRQFNAELLATHELTINDFDVLAQLSRAPEQALKRVDLAESVLLTPSGITRLLDGLPHICAEVVYAIRNEMAMTIEDVLARRTGLQLYDWRKAVRAAPAVASLLARELGWTAAETQQAIAAYAEKINDFLAALGLPAEPALQATDLRTTFDPM